MLRHLGAASCLDQLSAFEKNCRYLGLGTQSCTGYVSLNVLLIELCAVPLLQPVLGICHVAAARRLAILCDGALVLLDEESLEGQALPGLKVHLKCLICCCLLAVACCHHACRRECELAAKNSVS